MRNKLTLSFANFTITKRKENGLSQWEMANRLSISRSTLAKIELGESSPSLETIHQILKLFNLKFCDLDSFLGSECPRSKVINSLKFESDRVKVLNYTNEL